MSKKKWERIDPADLVRGDRVKVKLRSGLEVRGVAHTTDGRGYAWTKQGCAICLPDSEVWRRRK